jgi:hypothetical protein
MHSIIVWNVQILNEIFCIISIIKLWDVKFVMYVQWKINGN